MPGHNDILPAAAAAAAAWLIASDWKSRSRDTIDRRLAINHICRCHGNAAASATRSGRRAEFTGRRSRAVNRGASNKPGRNEAANSQSQREF